MEPATERQMVTSKLRLPLMIPLLIVCLLLPFQGNAWAQAEQQAPNITIGPGDMLNVNVFDIAELSASVRVNQNGEANLPVLGLIQLAGLSANQASRKIENELRERGLVIDPHVTVSVSEYATQGATLMGEVKAPGVYPTLGTRTLLDMISLAGGVTSGAGKVVSIIHRNDPQNPIHIELASNPAGLASQRNPVIVPGDTVVVAKAGVIYVIGDVGRPGGYLLDNNAPVSLVQSLTLAGGVTKTAALSQARLIRKVPDGREEVRLDLKHILYGKQADLKMNDGDILFVPSSLGKTLTYRGMEAVITAATQIVIYTQYR